jgi:hypothetical protein
MTPRAAPMPAFLFPRSAETESPAPQREAEARAALRVGVASVQQCCIHATKAGTLAVPLSHGGAHPRYSARVVSRGIGNPPLDDMGGFGA